jgi:class 3 adenylate cyclase
MELHTLEESSLVDLARLLLEDVCTDLVRFLHSREGPLTFGEVRVDREYALGHPGAFADLRVEPGDEPPYFMEVKYGFDASTLLAHLSRKYSSLPDAGDARKLILVVDTASHADWPALEAAIRALLPPHLALEVWDEQKMHDLTGACFGSSIASFSGPELMSIRERIDEGKDRLAFGKTPAKGYADAFLRQNLIWHFGTWRMRELRQAREDDDLTQLVRPGGYDHVVVLMADLSGFSRYVHDTADDATVRESLTSFYAKSRYQVVNAGGMLVQFVGDEVVALFGIPDRRPDYIASAVRTAYRLLDIGASVSLGWQRRIDHVQPRQGVHIAMGMGRVQVVPMRALDNARLATIGDCLDITARLMPLADQGEIVVSNVLQHAIVMAGLPCELEALPPFDARSLGMLQPWRLAAAAPELRGAPGRQASQATDGRCVPGRNGHSI